MSSTDLARSADAVCANRVRNSTCSGPSPNRPSTRPRTTSTAPASSGTANASRASAAASSVTTDAASTDAYGRYTSSRTSSSRSAVRNAHGARSRSAASGEATHRRWATRVSRSISVASSCVSTLYAARRTVAAQSPPRSVCGAANLRYWPRSSPYPAGSVKSPSMCRRAS